MLRTITDDLWTIEGEIRLAGGNMPARATIMRLSNQGLLVHSPLAIDDATADAVARLGTVAWIVAPNCMHHLYVEDAVARWPEARVLGAPGLEPKMKAKAKRAGVAFEPLPARGWVIDGEMAVRRIEGAPSISEHVFFHSRSRTLVVTDLVFNVHASRSFSVPLLLRLVGAWKKLAQSRMWRLLVKDRAAAAASVEEVLGWGFDRLVMSHGDVVETDARERLEGALAGMRHAPTPAPDHASQLRQKAR